MRALCLLFNKARFVGNMVIKIRVGYDRELHEFDSRNAAFNWVRETQGRCIITVMTFQRGRLETANRWHYDGNRFSLENIRS